MKNRSKQQQAQHPTDWAMELLASEDALARERELNAELLAALKDAVEIIGRVSNGPRVQAMRAAIAKAEGR